MDQAARVQRIRVPAHTGSPDRVTQQVKQQVTRWLEAQTPARLGLPTDAIVVLRSVRAPWSALHPDSPADVLRQRLRNAIRPAKGAPMGTGCDAVWFADEAELLACLASDSVQGQLGHRWWWQTWLGHRPAHEEALQAWLSDARRAPAAMAQLTAMGQGLAWARHIGMGGRQALVQAMQRHHPVAQAASNWLPMALSDAQPVNAHGDGPNATFPGAAGAHRDGEAIAHSSQPTGDQASAGWAESDGASVLLALCTLLHEAPHLALDERRLVAHLQPVASATEPPRQQVPHLAAAAHRDAPSASTRSVREADTEPSQPAPHRDEGGASSWWSPEDQDSRQAPQAPVEASREQATAVANLAPETPDASKPDAQAALSQSIAHRHPPQPVQADTAWPQAIQQSMQTAHGGVFFLLNVALAWELYGDFTRPQNALLSVSPWQFLHAAAIALLGRPFAADPLAGWLRAQAPFSRARPASALGGSPRSLLPEAEARRLAAARDTATVDALANAHAAPRIHGTTISPRSTKPDDELRTWWPLLRQRLSLALNLPEREAIATCLNLPARVERRGERVDVRFSLHHLPLPIRLAGLDRDPGWVPASGCDIRFHFEA